MQREFPMVFVNGVIGAERRCSNDRIGMGTV